MPVIPASRRQRLENKVFKASWGYMRLKTSKFVTRLGFLDGFQSRPSGLQAQMGSSDLECDGFLLPFNDFDLWTYLKHKEGMARAVHACATCCCLQTSRIPSAQGSAPATVLIGGVC